MSRLQATVASRLDVAQSDLKCLQRLQDAGPVAPSALAELTGHTKGAVTGMIDRLEAAGFVERTSDPSDGRRRVVRPVRRVLSRRLGPLEAKLGAAFETIGRDFTNAELKIVARYLARAVEELDSLAAELEASGTSTNP